MSQNPTLADKCQFITFTKSAMTKPMALISSKSDKRFSSQPMKRDITLKEFEFYKETQYCIQFPFSFHIAIIPVHSSFFAFHFFLVLLFINMYFFQLEELSKNEDELCNVFVYKDGASISTCPRNIDVDEEFDCANYKNAIQRKFQNGRITRWQWYGVVISILRFFTFLNALFLIVCIKRTLTLHE